MLSLNILILFIIIHKPLRFLQSSNSLRRLLGRDTLYRQNQAGIRSMVVVAH